MNRLASYIIASVLRGTAIVACALVTIAAVIEFVGQLDEVGLAAYGVREALLYVALRIPHKLFDVLPAATLIGALLGLGNLAVHRELVVMRTSGVSGHRLLAIVAAAGCILFIVMALLGESLAPRLGNYARTMRADALIETADTPSPQSLWTRIDDNLIVNLSRPATADELTQYLRLFELDGETGLVRIIEGELLATEPLASDRENIWNVYNYVETTFAADGTTALRSPRMQLELDLGSELLALTERPADMFELGELAEHIRSLQARELDASDYLVAYWGRIASGASVVLMAMLALPFVLGSLRSAGAGARMIIGLVIGLGYFILGRLSTEIGDVFALDPVAAAWAPSVVLLVVTALALSRLR